MKIWLNDEEVVQVLQAVTGQALGLPIPLTNHPLRILRAPLWHSASAIWTLNGWIILNSRYFVDPISLSDAWLLSVVAHELCHLRQGWTLALSVKGELEAWQVGFTALYSVKGGRPNTAIQALLGMAISDDRQQLARARQLMAEYAGRGYGIQFYPLLPLPQEIKYRIGRLFKRPM